MPCASGRHYKSLEGAKTSAKISYKTNSLFFFQLQRHLKIKKTYILCYCIKIAVLLDEKKEIQGKQSQKRKKKTIFHFFF